VQSSDREIAIVLSKQGWKSPNGLPFNELRVRAVRERGTIPPAAKTPLPGAGVSINEAARRLGVRTPTIRRWLQDGLLPAEETTEPPPGVFG
jgi:hypothetical protein